MRILAIALAIPLLLGNDGGCGSKAEPPVQIVADTYCLTVKKRSWSVNDTPESIDEAMRHNSAIDRACRKT
jgi:hypothetical protein